MKKPITTLIAAAVVALAAGCGGDEGGDTAVIKLAPPKKPTAARCGKAGKFQGSRSTKPPKPGSYAYATTGRRVLIGGRRRVFRMPATTRAIVTPTRRVGSAYCFAMQRRYEQDLGDTGIFIIRGSDLYLRTLRFQAGGYTTSFTPDPPVLMLSGSELDWSGGFRSSTSGRYEAHLAGRRSFEVGGKHVRAVGVATRSSYAGDMEGWDRSTRWFSAKRSIVVAESVTQVREFGLDRIRLTYRARLTSLKPS